MDKAVDSPMLAKSFPLLMNDLVEKHHHGNLLAMCQASRIPYTTLWRWQRGLSRRYDFWNVQRLCEHYEIDQREVWDIIHRDIETLQKRGEVAIPDLTDVRRGPVPAPDSPRSKKKTARHGSRHLRPDLQGSVDGVTTGPQELGVRRFEPQRPPCPIDQSASYRKMGR